MIRSIANRQRWPLLALGLVLGAGACAGQDILGASADEVAVSGGGVTVDVLATNSWQGGFNGAVRIINTSFPAPITSFQVVFQLGGGASISGTPWNGDIAAPDASGARSATQPSWLPTQPIATGQTWDVGFPGSGAFVSSTVVSVKINGQSIAIGGGGGPGPDTTPPTVSRTRSGAHRQLSRS